MRADPANRSGGRDVGTEPRGGAFRRRLHGIRPAWSFIVNHSQQLPDKLIEAVRSGECVAFLGAGFVMPKVPGWQALLRALAQTLEASKERDELVERLHTETLGALELEAVAQHVQDSLKSGFEAALESVLQCSTSGEESVPRRLQLLSRIPFKGIVTTNFDATLKGFPATPERFVRFLSRRGSPWEASAVDSRATHPPTPRILKLHGQVGDQTNPVVLARQQYRQRVHGGGAYGAFVKSLLATHPIVFLGTSFTDAYLNEMRSEVLSWFQDAKGQFAGKPSWWAVFPEPTSAMESFFLRHEGIEIIPYPVVERGHQGFDDVLAQLERHTAPEATLVDRLKQHNARMLWLDPSPENNALGFTLFGNHAEPVTTVDDAIRRIREQEAKAEPYDLVISRHGYREKGSSDAHDLLHACHSQGLHVPVVVFASGYAPELNRTDLRRHGALDYTADWPDLFRVVAEYFESEGERRARTGRLALN